MHVLFAIEAGAEFGIGHLMRCRALMLECAARGHGIGLLIRGDADSLEGRDWPAFTHLGAVPAASSGSDVVTRLGQMLPESGCTHVIADGYSIHGDLLLDTCHAHGSSLLTLDDIGGRDIHTDLLLNQNTDDASLYSSNTVRRLLGGPKYALLDRAYTHAAGSIEVRDTVRHVLVSFGGLDRHNRAQWILEALAEVEAEFTVDVILGPYYKHPAPKTRVSHQPVTVHRNVASLLPHIRQSDMGILGAGSTVWQACCLGLPMLSVQTVDNQRHVVTTLQKVRAALCLAAQTDQLPERHHVAQAVTRLLDREERKQLSTRAAILVDGNGAERVMNIFEAYRWNS